MARKLTEKQADFVNQVAKGVNATKAARASGYVYPSVDACRLMKLSHVLEALHTRREAALKGDLASLAVDAMRDLLRPETPAATRYQAAKWTLEQAGHGGGLDQDHDTKPMEEMDADELARAVTSGMSALQELADQMKGHHVVDGQARRVATLDQEEGNGLGFLQ